jgi:PTS system nitrogen regulatory IIA component
MQLTVRDAARALQVSEKTLHRWITQRGLPAHHIENQYRFNASELLEWATTQGVQVNPDLLQPGGAAPLPRFTAALTAGGVHYRLPGLDKQAVLSRVVSLLKLPPEIDRAAFLQVLLAREAAGSTAIGEGIAIPHVRDPIVLRIAAPVVTLCFLEQPVHFDAIDGKPVHTLFALVTPTVREHLHLLSFLGYVLRDEGFKSALRRQAPPAEILAEAARAEADLARSAAAQGGR